MGIYIQSVKTKNFFMEIKFRYEVGRCTLPNEAISNPKEKVVSHENDSAAIGWRHNLS